MARIDTPLSGVNAIVVGRVGVDLYPLQLNTRLEDVTTFEKFVGGFAGNVATGLARLGVNTAIASAVGDDGHGRYVRKWLSSEGIDTTWLCTHPTLRTALAFCEAWPPDRFPVTFYRMPTCPDWELRPQDLPLGDLETVALAYFSGTGLVREPSRSATLEAMERRKSAIARREPAVGATTVFDLDWRTELWAEPTEYGALSREAVAFADTVIGGATEFEAARLTPEDALELGATVALVKHGPRGATVIRGGGSEHVEGLPVPVTNGLGAGDAFAAAYGAGILAGEDPAMAARRANAAGAIVATRLSCSAAMPTVAELETLLDGGSVIDGVVQPRRRG